MISQARDYINKLDTKQWLWGAAGLSIIAAVIHGIVTPEHFEEWWGYGTFFLVAALFQMFYGLALIFQPWQPDPIRETSGFSARSVYLVGIMGNVLIILLYVTTRTVGVPFFGPEAGEVEDLTLLSLVSKVTEIALVLCLGVLIRRLDTDEVAG
jgi:hypothetical protein